MAGNRFPGKALEQKLCDTLSGDIANTIQIQRTTAMCVSFLVTSDSYIYGTVQKSDKLRILIFFIKGSDFKATTIQRSYRSFLVLDCILVVK